MRIRVPFSGWLDSGWSIALDSVSEGAMDSLSYRHQGIDPVVVGEIVTRHTDRGQLIREFTSAYVAAFQRWLDYQYEVDVSLTCEGLPALGYEFATDHITCDISLKDARKLYHLAGVDRIAAAGKRVFGGFVSPDIASWGELVDWSSLQLYTILVALSTEDLETVLLDNLEDAHCDAYDRAVDWFAVTEVIDKAEGRHDGNL